MKKVKIESAYPQMRMLERPNSCVYEIWRWEVKYLIIPSQKGCKGCSIQEGKIFLPLTGLAYPKSVLAKEVRQELGLS